MLWITYLRVWITITKGNKMALTVVLDMALTQEQIEDIQNMSAIEYAQDVIDQHKRTRTECDFGCARATITTLEHLGAINHRQSVWLFDQTRVLA